jgi:hypothetical protein
MLGLDLQAALGLSDQACHDLERALIFVLLVTIVTFATLINGAYQKGTRTECGKKLNDYDQCSSCLDADRLDR